MDTLFRIETDRVALSWSSPRGKDPATLCQMLQSPSGFLTLRSRRTGLTFTGGTWRSGVPAAVAADPAQTIGPRLYEETDYKVYIRALTDQRVTLLSRDPLLCRDMGQQENGRVTDGYVNFHSQIGRSTFMVCVDGQPEFDLELEVFPSKLDYAEDYRQILAAVQDTLTGLALEYLRSAYQPGQPVHAPAPSDLEWLTLLRHIVDDLERALSQVAQRPVRSLRRELGSVRAEQVRRPDTTTRNLIRRGGGSGPVVQLNNGLSVHQRLAQQRAQSTLDSVEHRWLAKQLDRIRQRLSRLRHEEAAKPPSLRRESTLNELGLLEARITRLGRLEPLAAANGEPPAGFASLQLLAAPGYREAYQACMVLGFGLRIEDGPMHLTVKDLNLLYEYWCYLALLRIVATETGQRIPIEGLLAIKQRGVQVLLHKGRETTLVFGAQAGRRVKVVYNPCFQGVGYLIPQQPDMMITIEDPHWPKTHLVLDAKYRLDASPEYREMYLSPGPPQDALNVLHRYRDAIRDVGSDEGIGPSSRVVIQAAALFPYREEVPGQFQTGRLWQSLGRLGVGAIPLLPSDTHHLQDWLRHALRQGGWALASKATPHSSLERARQWQVAASTPVLVGTLRGENQQERLDWTRDQKLYYVPLSETQRRFYSAKWLAIYERRALSQPGRVSVYASIDSLEIVPRSEIKTPWPAHGDGGEMQVLYHLGKLQRLPHDVLNTTDDALAQRFSSHRWTSFLALQRAQVLTELLLETEPEWRLYEDLHATGLPFSLKADRVLLQDPTDPIGRAWFVTPTGMRVRYRGSAGFQIRKPGEKARYYAYMEDVVAVLEHENQGHSSNGR